jgi:hypothetical protein
MQTVFRLNCLTAQPSNMKGELRWRGANSISKFDHHDINGGDVDNTWRHREKTCKLNLLNEISMLWICSPLHSTVCFNTTFVTEKWNTKPLRPDSDKICVVRGCMQHTGNHRGLVFSNITPGLRRSGLRQQVDEARRQNWNDGFFLFLTSLCSRFKNCT